MMTTAAAAKPQRVSIWYLENDGRDFKRFTTKVTPVMKELLNREMRTDYAHAEVDPPGIRIETRRLATVDEFVESVSRLVDGDDDAAPTLILLDYYLPNAMGAEIALADYTVEATGEDFFAWLERMLPGVPHRVLTSANYSPVFDGKHIFKGRLKDQPRDLANALKEVLLKHRATFWQGLRTYANRQVTSWHTPGHNKGTAFMTSPVLRPFYEAYTQSTTPLVFSSDLSVSVAELGDLSEPAGRNSMADAMRRAAHVFGSSRTYFCTNGTSAANKTLLMTVLKPGEVVIVDRNCHKSVHQAIVLAGAVPHYLTPRFNAELKTWYPISYDDIRGALAETRARGLRPRMLVLTTCTYDGVLFPVYEIAKAAHEYGVLFHADEAWFPYGRFHPFYAAGRSAGRYNALDSDADFCVHSSHKALAAFSQASMLHVGKHFERLLARGAEAEQFAWLRERFRSFDEFEHQLVENLTFWLSTSPHYPMIATLDCASAQMSLEGARAIGALLKSARRLHGWAAANGCAVTQQDLTGGSDGFELYGHDLLRFMVKVKPGRLKELKESLLLNHQQQWEKSSEGTILFLVTLGTSESDVDLLLQSLEQCGDLLGGRDVDDEHPSPEISGQVVILPRDAHYARGRYLNLSELKTRLGGTADGPAATAVACHMVTPYPPGIPTLLPGLPVTESSIVWIESILRNGGEVHGLVDPAGDPKVRVLLGTDDELRDIQMGYGRDASLARTLASLTAAGDAS